MTHLVIEETHTKSRAQIHTKAQVGQSCLQMKLLTDCFNRAVWLNRSPKGAIERVQIEWVIISCLLVQFIKENARVKGFGEARERRIEI